MPARDLRLVFAGTPDFAAGHLAFLLHQNFNVVSAYSQPDRPTGRGKKLSPTPVKALAQSHDIPVFQPEAFAPDALNTLAGRRPDLMIVVAYGLLLPPAVLALPRLGCINVHASLLPRWRGAAPIERAILEGDHESGVSIMQMEAGLDTGPVLGTASTPIYDDDTSAVLTRRLLELGCVALVEVVEQLAAGTARAVPQNPALVTYAHKLRKEEAAVDWSKTAAFIHRQVRAFYPRSPAFCLHQGQRVRILTATVRSGAFSAHTPGRIVDIKDGKLLVACGEGALEISDIQLEGKARMSVRELLNGHADLFKPGDLLLSASAHVPPTE
jgi:methionyl-tRNA formyltransferase